jgi:antitoxin MazE
VRIGNSQGIRIPKTIIEQCGFRERVELTVRGATLVVAALQGPRQGWEESLAKAGQSAMNEPPQLPDHLAASWDATEWTW